ncbi:glyoxylate reductase/hydroxypyruvate reductase [Drosophila tropicalis]|uniref:glyoxylate reductase/hydroxypyruvate reductase n=1 Tax=Drosophila tropicalis TaxID=46794 RepID=UPI0035AB6EEC
MSSTQPAFKVLIGHPDVPTEAIDLLRANNCEIVQILSEPPQNRIELLEKIKGVDAALWNSRETLNAQVLIAAGPQFRVVSTMSSGINFIHLDELKKRNIPLGSTPKMLSIAVADLAVGLLIAAARRFEEARRKIDSDQWENFRLNWLVGQDIQGSTVGLFGFGAIGQAIAQRLAGFEIERVLYTTRSRVDAKIEEKLNATKVDFDVLLAESDFIVIAAPLTPETQGIFNAKAFNKMKKNSVLVNIARGKLVNQDDLYEALKSNRIFAAGLDVTDPEPLPPSNKLLTLDNAVVLPHIGYATERSRLEAAILAAQNILCGLHGKPMPSPAY